MSTEHQKRHRHAGRSSQSFLDPKAIIDALDLHPGNSVLDVGCGNGYVSLYAAAIVGQDGIVYAVDSDQRSIDSLQSTIGNKSLTNIIALREDVTQGLSIAPHSIDICLMVNVFHGFVMNDELSDVFRFVNRVLKDQGKLVVVDFEKGKEIPGPPQEVRIAISEAARILLRNGFDCRKNFSPGPYHYGLIFVKS